MPLGGREVDDSPAGEEMEPPPTPEVVALDQRAHLLRSVARQRAQVVEVDLDVEVPGVGEHGAVLHPLEVLAAQDGARAGDGDEHVAALGGLQRRHDLEAVHPGLQRAHRVHLAHDHRRAGPAGALGDPLARPAVADDHKRVAGQQEVGGAQDAVQRRLPGAVAVVEGTLRERLVHGQHRVGEPACGVEAADTDQARGGVLRPAEDDLGRPALVEGREQERQGRFRHPGRRGKRVRECRQALALTELLDERVQDRLVHDERPNPAGSATAMVAVRLA